MVSVILVVFTVLTTSSFDFNVATFCRSTRHINVCLGSCQRNTQRRKVSFVSEKPEKISSRTSDYCRVHFIHRVQTPNSRMLIFQCLVYCRCWFTYTYKSYYWILEGPRATVIGVSVWVTMGSSSQSKNCVHCFALHLRTVFRFLAQIGMRTSTLKCL